jgi:hypothetical protein
MARLGQPDPGPGGAVRGRRPYPLSMTSPSGGAVPPRQQPTRGIPASLWFAATAWLGVVVVDVYAATDALAANRREPEADRIAGQLGPDVVSGPPALASTPAIAIVAAVATIALTAALLAGRGWARFALVGLGIVTGVVLAWDGRLHAVAVFVLVAAVASVLPSAHRFLAAPDAR